MKNSSGGIAVNEIANPDEIIFAPKARTIQIPVCDKTVVSEISEDFTLPDYLPEIRRLLRITPSLPAPSRYLGGNMAEFSGNVGWAVLYVGGDGCVACANLSSPYEASAEFDPDCGFDPESTFEADDEITPENVVGRVTAPRRMNIRARLNHRIRAFGDRSVDTEIYGESSPDSVQKLTTTLPACRIVGGVDDSVELEDTFPLADGSRIVGVNGSVAVENAVPDDNGTVCRGSVTLRLMSAVGDGEPTVTEHRLPFTANTDTGLDGDGWCCRAFGRITDLSADMSETDAVCRVTVCVTSEAQKNLPAQFTSDVFSTEQECELSHGIYIVPCGLACGNLNFTHDGSASLDGLSDGAKIIDVICTAGADSVSLEKGRYILTGKCRYNLLFADDGEYSARETELPFRCEAEVGNTDPDGFSACLTVASCSAHREGENIACTAEVSVSYRIFANRELDAIAEAGFGRELDRRRAAFTVAYLADGDTLWDIAKRYSVSPADLAAANALPSSTPDNPALLSGMRYLIV